MGHADALIAKMTDLLVSVLVARVEVEVAVVDRGQRVLLVIGTAVEAHVAANGQFLLPTRVASGLMVGNRRRCHIVLHPDGFPIHLAQLYSRRQLRGTQSGKAVRLAESVSSLPLPPAGR